MAQTIYLSDGTTALVDDCDYPLLSRYHWSPQNKYAATKIGSQSVTMHRFVFGPTQGMMIDHVNGNPRDNRFANLRLCTVVENSQNMKPHRDRVSGSYKGVSRAKDRYVARIKVGGCKSISLGSFETVEEAAREYDNAAIRFFGPFARVNFPDEVSHVPTEEEAAANVRAVVDTPRKPRSSNYIGVQKATNCESRWSVGIRVEGKRKYIGMFADEVEAAQAYDTAARELRGENAVLNFPAKASL